VHYAVPHATAALLAKDIAREEKLHFPNVLTTLHGTDITLLARDKTIMPVIKYSIESSCGVTAVSESLKRDTLKLLKSRREIGVIHNFYNPKKITKKSSLIRKSLGIKEDDFLAIHLSNLRPVKRIPDLLAILGKVKNYPKIKLLILSGGNFSFFESLVEKLGIQDRVIIKSGASDIENYINAADLGIYTSEEESFGMGILETMSYGKPVLATNVGGVGEFMETGKTGYLLGVGKINDFAKRLQELSQNPVLAKKLGSQAQTKVLAGFTSKQMVVKYVEYYRHIINTCR
jgi:N-acetyl-alpha-D-glucosaminyl L-malate synthase BshA